MKRCLVCKERDKSKLKVGGARMGITWRVPFTEITLTVEFNRRVALCHACLSCLKVRRQLHDDDVFQAGRECGYGEALADQNIKFTGRPIEC
jgi:hypothetical protein